MSICIIWAVGWCDAAIQDIEPDRPIPISATTRARLYLLEQPPNFRAAAAVLDDALAVLPADLNLLLVRARVEIQRGDLAEALRFISQALYVDPSSEPALRLRVEAYLDIAAQTDEIQRRIQLYGTAVIWSQEYLIFYPGEPAGYMLLARSRLGEGKLELAEEALSRIINVERTLPETEAVQEIVQRAHILRANIYKQTARYDEALDDIEFLMRNDPDNVELIREQADLAFRLDRYALALESTDALLNVGVSEPERTNLLLRKLRLTTQICEFTTEVSCEYEATLSTLTDDFIAGLSSEQALEARSYRAKAAYHVTLDSDSLNQNQRTQALQTALNDLDAVLRDNETPVDVYYRGLILEAMDNPDEALLAYDWVAYWSQFFEYPFTEDVQARIEELRPEDDTA